MDIDVFSIFQVNKDFFAKNASKFFKFRIFVFCKIQSSVSILIPIISAFLNKKHLIDFFLSFEVHY